MHGKVVAGGFIPSTFNISTQFTSALQLTTGSIQMSSSAVGTLTAGTNVSYTVNFSTATTGTIEGVVIDFCSNDPLPGDNCTAPGGFTVGTAVTASNTGLNPTASSSWTPSSVNSGRTFEFQDASGGSVSSGTPISFQITGNTNPSATGTFYARIFTFASTSAITTWNGITTGSSTTGVTDDAGVALTTVNQITITFKVAEQITFCVYTAALDSGNCGAATGTTICSVTLMILSSTGPYVDLNTKYDIQTNALHSAMQGLWHGANQPSIKRY